MDGRLRRLTAKGNLSKEPASIEAQGVAKSTRKLTALACNRCRRGKIKCSGTAPCAACIRTGAECIFVETKRDPLDLARNKLSKHQNAIARLYEVLGNGDQHALQQLRETARLAPSLGDFLSTFSVDAQERSHPDIQDVSHQSEQVQSLQGNQDEIEISHAIAQRERSPLTLIDDPLAPQTSGINDINQPSHLQREAIPWHLLLEPKLILESAAAGGRILDVDNNGLLITRDEEHSSTGPVEVFGNLPLSSAILTNSYPTAAQTRQLLNRQTHEYMIPSFHVSDDPMITRLFYGFKSAAMEQIANGIPVHEVLGHSLYIDVELFFRDRMQDDPFDADSWASEIAKSFEAYDIYVLLGSCALWTKYMRWCILPTQQNYALMPFMIRPIPYQRLVPDNMTVDMVSPPAIRDVLVFRYRDWITPGSKDGAETSVGWLHGLEAAIEIHPLTGRRVLTSDFVHHATNAANWSLDKSAL